MAGFGVPGWKFRPGPHHCIEYLTCKVTSKPLRCDANAILDLDPYNAELLPDLFSSLRKMDARYLFTKLRSQGKIGGFSIINRGVGNGTWLTLDPQDLDRITDEEGKYVGNAQKLTYVEKGSKYSRRIQMTEYTLLKGTAIQYDSSKDFVLCEITRKGRWNDVSESKPNAIVSPTEPVRDSDFPSDNSDADSNIHSSFDSSPDSDEEKSNPSYTSSPTSSSCHSSSSESSSESESQATSPASTSQDGQDSKLKSQID